MTTRLQCSSVAGVLTGLRQAYSADRAQSIHPALPEILLWVAAGCDHATDLCQQTGINKREVGRLLAQLSGKTYRCHGLWRTPQVRLIEARDHPHRRGHQWRLTEAGLELVHSLTSS